MKKLFFVANWKSNKLSGDVDSYDLGLEKEGDGETEVVVCPPFTLIDGLKRLVEEKGLKFKVGAQDISPFGEGAYTGEVNGKQVKEFCEYVIVGHSERRDHFGEHDEMLKRKVAQALENEIMPIYCIQDENTFVPEGVSIVAYEPVSAIGTGNPDTPENAERVAESVMSKNLGVRFVLYGGSVNVGNVRGFVEKEHVSGVLVGGASLDPDKFADLIKAAS